MTKVRKYTISSAAALAVTAGVSLVTAPVQAAAIVNYFNGTTLGTTPLTLTELFNSGAYIIIDEDGNNTWDKKFSNWANDTSMPFTAALSNGITVTGFGSPLSAGLQYDSTNFAKTGTGVQMLSGAFSYKAASINPEFLIKGVTLDLTGSTATITGGNMTSIALASIDDSYTTFNPNNVLDSFSTVMDMLTSSTSGTPVSEFNVMSQLALTGSGAGTKTLAITQFRQTFSQATIPEPGTVVGLLVVSSLGLGMKRKQKDN